MRKSVLIAGLGLFLLAAVLLAFILLLSSERSFEVRGRVAGFGDDERTVIVEHEAVPGYMPAMTMPFEAREADELDGLSMGDAVRFRLVVTSERSWIERVERLPRDALPVHPAAENEPKLTVPGKARLLEAGDVVPDIRLTNQDGEPIRLNDFEGQALLVTFIYTRCPLPDYCPLMSRNFRQLQPRLEQAFEGRAHLLSISFDPEYDTPAVLKDYAARYTDDLSNWTFATGEPEEVGRAAALFGVYTEASEDQIVHNLTTALIGPDGRLVKVWRGNDWKPEEVLRTVARMPDSRDARTIGTE